MSQDPIANLGLSCPSGGGFHICQDSDARFVGCCSVDPCDSDNGGNCPAASLFPAAFDPAKYEDIPSQSCALGNALFYTCVNGPTFLGCCKSNPCDNEGVCPDDDFSGAVLAADPKSAAPFVTSASATASSTSSSSTASTTSDTAAATTTAAGDSSHSSSAPIGAIVGGVIGGLVILVLLALGILRYRRHRIKQSFGPPDADDGQMINHRSPPWSPYQDSFRSSPALKSPNSPWFGSAPNSPKRSSLSESLLSSLGFKRSSAGRHSMVSSDYDPSHGVVGGGQPSPGFLNPVAELDVLPPHGLRTYESRQYFEVPGSIPEHEPRPPPRSELYG